MTDINDAVFDLKAVSYAYAPGRGALSQVNLPVRAGERLCVLGANGCGKSTLFRLLAGLLTADTGSFSAFGRPVGKRDFEDDDFAKAYHKRVGFVFQDSDVQLFCSTVREELSFGPLQAGLSAQEVQTRVRDTAELLGIAPLLDTPPFHLSGGEKKKVALGSVLILNPDVLLLDEPMNMLDPRTRRFLQALLLQLSGAGRTLLVSTHNLEFARSFGGRAVLFDEQHRIKADGPVEALLQNEALLEAVNLV